MLAEYLLLFAAALVFEGSYVAWARSAAAGGLWSTAWWSVVTAAMGLLGLKGALELPLGWLPYLLGIGTGALAAAYLGRAALVNKHTSAAG